MLKNKKTSKKKDELISSSEFIIGINSIKGSDKYEIAIYCSKHDELNELPTTLPIDELMRILLLATTRKTYNLRCPICAIEEIDDYLS